MISGVEIKRKIVHLSTLSIPVGVTLLSKKQVLTIVIPLTLVWVAVDLLRLIHPAISNVFQRTLVGKVLREKERHALMGSTYFLISTCLIIVLFPKSIAIASLLILILSDTCAALVGKGIGRVPIFGKTVEGSTAFFLSALMIVWLTPGLNRVAGSLAALGATLVELLPIGVDDNFSIPLVAGTIMFFAGG